ncbi:MAG: hypothetical protein A2504_06880 [Bdellovibrionales bacterium RIFOXYD12_FULL_39_22]|nr:MAG: hypothetical protein A2385_09200 [Bdellovibrionales bacterium RIFOXYB1_FULL_39_21]OFZ45126.1 MAG: hypothetical protein A2485_05340 [Bdellovibrionales bacterium RIFOXYC12_FULL_39_17]OFZ45682.1 MAG: hypothetical protein A2404_03780 [Bdellovibrionales bacterium RIFOXYC1_FULL_39_130]OFZ72653.1 MAG: hypothetical protein A2451_14280 [Bdellovibrionales bacterium RIFOXYC2_FULL_39_8]OFZ77544.1 MAG: hypothetical protein A2560_09365 [Bdellovibrionales bacterium RIFOXYD1_FULL_39_84]OFZ91673.1 MAG:
MKEKIYEMLMEYTSLVDALVEKSEAILLASEQGNIDFINREAENRLSLVNILEHIQDKIDLLIPQINDLNSNRELLELLKVWLGELEIWSGRVQWIDNQIYDFLNAMKEDTAKEVANIFRSINQFKGYDLSSVKK